jgi:PAS domain-containing protein
VEGVTDLNHTSTLTGLQKALQGSRKNGAVDVIFTKLAVDLQTLDEETVEVEVPAHLAILCEAIGCDAVCIGLFDPGVMTLERVFSARATFSGCNPEVLQGRSLDDLPWLGNCTEHLRLYGINDTSSPESDQQSDAEVFASLHIGAMMLVGFDVRGRKAGFMGFFYGQPQTNWNVEHQLLLKLLSTSFASGLSLLRTAASLAVVEERDALLISTANDGTWDFDAINNVMRYSPRWQAIMGFSQEEIDREAPDWKKLVHVEDLAQVQIKLRSTLPVKVNCLRVYTGCVVAMVNGVGYSVVQKVCLMIRGVCGGWSALKPISPNKKFTKRRCFVRKRVPRLRCSQSATVL